MKISCKILIKKILRAFGVELHRISTSRSYFTQSEINQLKWLRDLEIKTILDIGANTGQFAQSISEILPNSTLYAFEPLPDCYAELIKNLIGLPKAEAFNIALGDETGKVQINYNEFSPSSSLLPLAELHKETFPYAQNTTSQEIEIARLDDIAAKLQLIEPILIKLDVQGFEDQVIEGGVQVISQAAIIIIELSIEPLYEKQLLFNDIYAKLRDLGFQYHGNFQQAYNNDGRILYVDSIFVRQASI